MNSKSTWIFFVLIVVCGSRVPAQPPAEDPIRSLLFPPEVLLDHRDRIGLTNNQVDQLRERMAGASPKAQQLQSQFREAIHQLTELLSADLVDEDAVLNQLDEVLAIEKRLKRLHISLMIRMRNDLNADQRKLAAQVQRMTPSKERRQQRLQAKLSQIEKEVQSRSQTGQPPLDVVALMQRFPTLMKSGSVDEAESLLDRAMKMLDIQPNAKFGNSDSDELRRRLTDKVQQVRQRAEELQQNGKDVSAIQELMQKVGPLIEAGKADAADKLIDEALKLTNEHAAFDGDKLRSLPDVRAEAAALKKQDVAWRGIEWKTCLLDGLRESRDQDKPVMLWVFIDRPIDDERC